jgi:hypothetical protein
MHYQNRRTWAQDSLTTLAPRLLDGSTSSMRAACSIESTLDATEHLDYPHVAGVRADYWTAATNVFIENLRRYRAGQPLINLVDPSLGY